MMNKASQYLLIAGALTGICEVNASSAILDWTPLFTPWENGCNQSEIWDTFRQNAAVYNSDTYLLELGNIVLPEIYRLALEDLNLAEREDYYSLFTIKAKYGDYYNIPVNSFGFYLGHANGMRTSYIELNASYEDASELLADVDYNTVVSDSGAYQAELIEVESSGKVLLICDESV